MAEPTPVNKPTGNTKKVELFTTSATFSLEIKKAQQSLKFLLEQKKVNYEEYDVASNEQKKLEMQQRSGQKKLPQLFIDGQFIGGYEEAQDLEEQGVLGAKLGCA
ncbi:hypothetical protein QOT17_012363 [Balamuthia mandrillaris]